jgi:glycosyltransferase involved in cell wall biosynthesis
MRIVLDLQGAQTGSRFRGIGHYTLSLAKAIVANRADHEVLIALSGLFPETIEPIRTVFDPILPQDNIRVWFAPGPVAFAPDPVVIDTGNTLRRQIAERIREAFLASLEPDVVHVSSLFEGFADDAVTSIGVFAPLSTAVTLYDLFPLTAPHPHPTFPEYYARKLESFHRANLWLGISQFSCQEAISLLHLEPDKVVNIGGAADSRFKRIDLSDAERRGIIQAYGLEKPFICSVGKPTESRKNVAGLMQAFACLAPQLRARFQIVIIGKIEIRDVDTLKRTACNLGLQQDQVVFAGYVDDDKLPLLYNICHAFVFPSFSEGFGLPVLEAMQCGAPVIASNSTSIPEVAGTKAALFDPNSVDDIADKLQRVLTDDEFRADLIARQLQQTRRFSWEESAKRAIKAFEDLHAAARTPTHSVSVYNDLITSTAQILHKKLFRRRMIISTAIAIAQNHPAPRSTKTLFIDVSELAQRDANTGVQRVTRSILKQLLERSPSGYVIEPVYGTLERPRYRYAKKFTQSFLKLDQVIEEERFIDVQRGDIFLGLDLQHHVVKNNADYHAYLRNLDVKVYFLVHDLLPIQFPHYFSAGYTQIHHEWLSVISQSDGVICVSRTVADQYIDWLAKNGVSRLRPLSIGWSHNGADLTVSAVGTGSSETSQAALSALNSGPSFLTVGTIEPRKGHAQVLAAFERLWDSGRDLRLVIVGKPGWMVETLIGKLRVHPKLGRLLFWLEDVSDEYLDRVYSTCSCLIAASEGEGFGLPLIEAAQHKMPILARDIPVFREVAGEHASYFSGRTPEALAEAITEWLKLRAQNRQPTSEGMPWLTWAQSAERLKAILLEGDWYKVWPADGRGTRIRNGNDCTTQAAESATAPGER